MRSSNNTALSQPWWQAVLNSPWVWLALAALPSVVLFCNRVLVPDFSTDVISYHLFNGMRAIHHPFVPFLPSEYYPVGIANIAPLYDALTYLSRSVVGYRLGTGLSLAAALGGLWIIYKLLILILQEQGKRFHAGWGLLLLNAGIVLELEFQLATYDIDVINSFFVLIVLWLVVRQVVREPRLPMLRRWWAGLWFGLGVLLALKLTNSALVIPMAGILVWDWWRRPGKGDRRYIVSMVACMALIIVPLLPGWLNNFYLSRNPVFPFYNGVFHSPEYPSINYTDTTFGGTTAIAKIVWPVASLGDQLRLGEPHHIYNDYKLILYWGLALLLTVLLCLRWVRVGLTGRLVLCYFLASTLLWGILFGILRYFISSMLIGGLVLALPFVLDIVNFKRLLRWALVATGAVCLLIASVLDYRIVRFNLHYDISWRPSYYQNEPLHKMQRHSLFANSLTLTPTERLTVQNADIFINCNTNVAGLIALLPGANSKPMVNIIADELPQYGTMTTNAAYRAKVLKRLQGDYPGRTKFTWVSIASDKDIGPTTPGCYRNLTMFGATVTGYQPINDFLGYDRIHTTLISGVITL